MCVETLWIDHFNNKAHCLKCSLSRSCFRCFAALGMKLFDNMPTVSYPEHAILVKAVVCNSLLWLEGWDFFFLLKGFNNIYRNRKPVPELIRLAFLFLKSIFLAVLGARRSPPAPRGSCSSWPTAVPETEISHWTASAIPPLCKAITTNPPQSTGVERNCLWK